MTSTEPATAHILEAARPIPILPTDHGSLLYTTNDLQEEITSPFIAQLELDDVVQASKQSLALHEMCKCLPKPSMLSVRHTQYGLGDATNTGMQVLTSNGKLNVSLEAYINHIRKERPNAVIAMADEVGPHCGRNRREKSMKRTVSWLKTLCESNLGCLIYGVCVGGNLVESRKQCAAQIKQLPVNGIVIGELFCGETAEERQQIVRAIREEVGRDLPLIVQGPATPLEVIELVEWGVDYIASNYAHMLTTNSMAICWDLQVSDDSLSGTDGPGQKRRLAASATQPAKRHRAEEGETSKDEVETKEETSTRAVVNLLDRENELRHTVNLMQDCRCHTCRRPHSRAYIHHLLRAHELTADVLLYQHNQWQWLRFFDALRHHLQHNTFDAFKAHIIGQLCGHSIA